MNRKKYTLEDFREAILANFGFYTAIESKAYSLGEQVKKPDVTRYDEIHGDCLKAPKHGNGDPLTEELLAAYEDWFCELCTKYESLYARPMYAYPGTDRNGPYALMASSCCWDQSKSQNSQMNMKFHPNTVRDLDGSKKLLALIRSYMSQGGFHVQFNIVDSKMLKEAQKHPDQNRDLLVRVSGFTQYWVETSKPVQDEVIARTEFEGGV